MANATEIQVGSGASMPIRDLLAQKGVQDLQKSTLNDPIDVLAFGEDFDSSFNMGGVAVTKHSKFKYSFYGTIAASDFVPYYASVNALPWWLQPGRVYYLTITGASGSNNVYFDVIGFKNNGATQVTITGFLKASGKYSFAIPADVAGVYVRFGVLGADAGASVNETIEYHIYTAPITGNEAADIATRSVKYVNQDGSTYATCDDVPANTVIFVSSSGGVLNIQGFPFNGPGTLVCVGANNFPVQIATNFGTTPRAMTRTKGISGWTAWAEVTIGVDSSVMKYKASYTYTSCDDIAENCFLFVGSSGGVLTIPDAPYIGNLMTMYVQSNIAFQMMYPWRGTDKIKYRSKNFDGWTSWSEIGSGGGTTTIVQEVSRDTYNNTYDITVSPTITTDANGWLQPVDTNTADETGKTDMTSAIMAMLNSTGYCHLAPGIYYVSGNIDMPADSMIEGCGKQTIIRLLQTQTSGYIVRMHTRSTLKNVCLSGGYNAGSISTPDIGGRKGINYIGNRDGQSSGVTPSTCTLCQIEGCWFENLDSGFYGYNAGGGLQEGVEMSNCYFTRCKAGINIDYWTEYCKFVNCVMFQCYFACINNGGNNVFMNCTFHGVVGFLIDNSSGTKSNSAHGSVIGCTFNHIDNMNHPDLLGLGYGIKVLDTTAGFLFANCQIWYGRIRIEDSTGVQITGCEIGGLGTESYPVIETTGTGMVFIDNCLFQSAPNFSIASPSKFTNCWTYNGNAVTV